MSPLIQRRISFLLETAKHEKTKDQAITFVMRVISNHATVGKDAHSAAIKQLNKKVTTNALDLLKEKGIKIYCKETINEHPKPLKQTWDWLVKNSNDLTIEDVWKEFCDHTMITITKEEDALIRTKGFKSKGSYDERYTALGINVIYLKKSPLEYN